MEESTMVEEEGVAVVEAGAAEAAGVAMVAMVVVVVVAMAMAEKVE